MTEVEDERGVLPPTLEHPLGTADSHAPPRHHHRGRWIVLGFVLGLLVTIVVAGFVWWNNRGPSRPSISDAIERFRDDGTTGTDAVLQPKPGVYIYEGTGEEKLSFLGTHQSQDGRLPATVTREPDGCWTFSIEYNSFHRQTWRRCQVGDRLVESGNTTDQKFDFGALSQSEHTTVACDPRLTLIDPADRPGRRERVRCTGHSQTTKATMHQRGVLTYVGSTVVTVAGRKIPALHFSEDVTISGGQTGTSREELWIAAADGLPLREERTISVRSPAPAPLNEVTYTEQGSWRLTSITPRT